MPRIAKELGALEVGRLVNDGRYAVGVVPGLHLLVAGKARSWILRTTVGSKRKDIGLGSFPAVKLAEAREKARAAREAIEAGSDPVTDRQAAKRSLMAAQASAKTFSDAVKSFLDDRSDEWKSAKHRQQWAGSLANYAEPVLGQMLVADIRQEDVLRVLTPIWKSKTETATRVRGRIEQILDWARVRGFRSGDNPARWRGHLDKLLPKPTKISTVQHFAALPIDAMPAFFADLQQRHGNAARALEMLALTCTRSGEIRGACWKEINVEDKVWTIPGARMKAGKEHRVPLSPRVIEILSSQDKHDGTDLVFPGNKGKPLSDMTLTALMRRMSVPGVPHGLRSTFRDWVAERTAFPNHVAEMALAHVLESKVEAAYRRGDLFDKRRELMRSWADFCTSATSISSR